MSKVTFQDRLKFNAFCSHVTNPSRHVTHNYTPPGQLPELSTHSQKTWKSVNFAPRYHQVRLTSAKLDFFTQTGLHVRAESAKRETEKMATLERLTTERKIRYNKPRDGKRDRSNVFLSSFRQLGPRDEDNDLAKMWRGFVTYPYKNPRAFDHRGLDPYKPRTQLHTVKTPDPFYIKLKNRSLSGNFKECYVDPDLSYGARDINFKFRTLKTPKLRYDPRLLRNKGPYSPAFTAREAYFSRVYKNIST